MTQQPEISADRLHGAEIREMPPCAPLTPRDPRRLGDLELLGRLGEGGQGVVYLAGTPAGAHVAVKWLQQDQSDDAVSVGRFLREAEVARSVAPFCTAAVLGTGVEDGRPYIVSEFVKGTSLQQIVQEEGPRTGPSLDRLAIGTATALAAIHQAGIVHRDFKPANVIVGAEGPRVIDFGIARALDATSTFSDTPVGTPAYMSPEQIMGHTVGPATDMFSWAGTMVFASSGRAPFSNDALQAVISRVLNAPPDLGRLDGPLREVVLRCLSKDPARRPSAEQVIKRLLGYPVPDSSLLVWGAKEASPTRRPGVMGMKGKRPIVIGLAAAALLALVPAGAAVTAALRNTPPGTGATTAAPKETVPAPATPSKTTLPGGAITLYEHPSDPITLTAYEIYNKNLDDDVDYARQSLHGAFERYPANWESLVSPDGRYLAGRPQYYTSDDHDSVLITDREAGSSFRVKTVRKPLISPIRAWSRDGSKVLLNIERKMKNNNGDDWLTLGFAIIDVAQAKVSVVNVADTSIQADSFGWDANGAGVVITYGDDQGLRFFDTSGKHTRDVPDTGVLAAGTHRVFSPSGKMFVTDCPGDTHGDHCLWDTGTGKQVRKFFSDCDKVLGWYDESHLYCWELDNNASHSEVQVVAFDGKLVRKLLEVPEELDFTPYFTANPSKGS
ncbi:protein kinase domain-containing protein [Nonomuraea sp. CA-141351]|uniref:protein kinase domain-containing protein n=1 Tax=Nonomuraea sp. CA-141351 TaxID=3239996 RepID=UPI003D8C9270